MSVLGFLILLIIAGICGAVAEAVIGFSPGGFLVSIAVGIIGAYLGTWVASRLRLPSLLPITVDDWEIQVGWTIIGAMILLFVLSRLRGPTRKRSARR